MDFVAAKDVAKSNHDEAVLFKAALAGKACRADVGAVMYAVEGAEGDVSVGQDGFDTCGDQFFLQGVGWLMVGRSIS